MTAAVLRFALAGVLALAIVAVVSFFATKRIGTAQAEEGARDIALIVGRGIVQPRLTRGVLENDPAALARFDRLIRRRVLKEPIVRVKIWTASGRLIYSDEPRLIGQRYELEEDDLAVLREDGVESEVSDLSRPENRFERQEGKLLEVYLGIDGPDGQPLLFEAYQQFSAVTSGGRDIWLAFLPALIAALVVLELIQLPLASSMARRIARSGREREALLERAVDASTAERRRIAGDLHDGVVQDLAGLSFSLAAGAERLDGRGEPESAALMRRASEETRRTVGGLRSLMVEIYPPNLKEAGIRAALSDLVAPLQNRGIKVSLGIEEDLELLPEEEALIYRVAQECIRNVSSHADARSLEISLAEDGAAARLTVADDGRGFEPAERTAAHGEGHMGLTLLGELADDAGAGLTISSQSGGGTTVTLEMRRR